MFMGFGFIIPVILVVGLLYLLSNRGESLNNLFSTSANNSKSALDIARERYAHGEIDKDEFEQLSHDLTS